MLIRKNGKNVGIEKHSGYAFVSNSLSKDLSSTYWEPAVFQALGTSQWKPDKTSALMTLTFWWEGRHKQIR